MRQDLDDLLCRRHSSIFQDRHRSMQETAMCWGFACGDGWAPLIDTLCAEIQGHVDRHALPAVVACQVKEKSGTLRFYTRDGDEYTHGLTWMADVLSGVLCETCGAPGGRFGEDWVQTRCSVHGGPAFPLDQPSLAHDEEDALAGARRRTTAAWRTADAFRLPTLHTRGWRHLAHALEATIRNDLRYNSLPPVTINGIDEATALHFTWSGGDSAGRLAAMFRLIEAYSARSDRVTGEPLLSP